MCDQVSAGNLSSRAMTLPRLPWLRAVGPDHQSRASKPSLALAAAAFPAGQIAHVPDAGHSVYFERPTAFNALIDRFLSEPLR